MGKWAERPTSYWKDVRIALWISSFFIIISLLFFLFLD